MSFQLQCMNQIPEANYYVQLWKLWSWNLITIPPPPPPSKGQWQYTKDLPFSNVNISWNKDDFLYKLCISQGRRLDSASRVQSSREVRMETRCSLGDWSLISGNVFFPWLLVSLTSLTISRQLVLIPKGPSSVLFSNKQTFNLTTTLSTSIFRAVKAT